MDQTPAAPPLTWQRFSAGAMRTFHAYAGWLVSISWKRFVLLSLLLVIVASILQSLPPFSWKFTETIDTVPRVSKPKPPGSERHKPANAPEKAASDAGRRGVDITIDERGVRITRRARSEPAAASAPASAASASAADDGVQIHLPAGVADNEDVKSAIEEAKRTIAEAAAEVESARKDGDEVSAEAMREAAHALKRVRTWSVGDMLMDLAWLAIVASAIIKITYKGQLQAEVKAAQATEVAESESLKRQVVEARMAAMQAQVEPHFLFNTLASIDHLIETDPVRASKMQKNLIALLRASMPTMREANAQGTRDLARELAVIKPYLEILKVRMDDRLQIEIDVPEGLQSAEFPPMMLQSLVENAIKHGLEPKPEGGRLNVKAEIVHGKLAVTVADTGLGFGKAATAGTGTGLANIRERLSLLYGTRAQLKITENTPSGTVASITVPYSSRMG